MNATELHTRLQNFACRIVVLCESLPPGKCSPSSVYYRLFKTTCRNHADTALRQDLSTALGEVAGTLSQLGSMIDLDLIHPSKLSSLKKEVDELTNIFTTRQIAVKMNESPGHY